eukprot:TRINITY_DN13528_c0_g4_i1.p1 TRINITY_DN13528_c0_g4~~TRINITY_DN13528_c0_g4_i1.p1  ORF type:complete len:4014 (+),score=1375.48 TRINITY_DN13528_c0_g4_i1:1072-12042(+)
MQELEKARDFLFSNYCPSRRLALPSCMRTERRVAVGPGSVVGLAVSAGKASVLIASSGGLAGPSLLHMENAGGGDRKMKLPFHTIDADGVPSLAVVSAPEGCLLAAAASAYSAPSAAGANTVIFNLAVCGAPPSEKLADSAWRNYQIKLPHPHKQQERVYCKVFSCGRADDGRRDGKPSGRRIAVISTSGVPIDEKTTASSSSSMATTQRRLLADLQAQHRDIWEAALEHVRAQTLPIETVVDMVIETAYADQPQLHENITLLLQQNAARQPDRNEDARETIIPRASVHWVTIPDKPPVAEDPPGRSVVSHSASPARDSPTAGWRGEASGADGTPYDAAPVPSSTSPTRASRSGERHSPKSQYDVMVLEPERSVVLKIPRVPSKRNRHRQSALSLTRNSLPEFSHPLPKLNKAQPCTLEAWVRGAVDSPATILCWGTPEYRVHLSIDRQKRHTLYFVGSTTKHHHRGVSASVPGADSHHWVHLCVTHDGANNWTLYRNGNPIGEPHQKDAHDKPQETEDLAHSVHSGHSGIRGIRVPRTSSIPDMRQSDRAMHGSVGNAFVGCVAEVRIWSECRTGEQVRAYLHTSLRPQDLTSENLLAYWSMDQSVGVQAYDHSVRRRHLLLQDGATWEHVPDMPVFRRTDMNPDGWPVYVPSLRNLSVLQNGNELMLTVQKLSSQGNLPPSRVVSTYDSNTGALLRENLVHLNLPVSSVSVLEGSQASEGVLLPLDGPLAIDGITGDIWALSQPTGQLASGAGGSSEPLTEDEIPVVVSGDADCPRLAGKGILSVLSSLAQRHTKAAPVVLSAMYLSPVVSCLKRLCRLLALGREVQDAVLCKGAAGLLKACFGQVGWSPQAIHKQQGMLEELYHHACAIADDATQGWTTPELTKAVLDLLQSGVQAGVFFPSTASKVTVLQKLLRQGWSEGDNELSKSEKAVLKMIVSALSGASAHCLLQGASVSQTLKQLLNAVRHPDAPPLLPLAVALQRSLVGLAMNGDEKAVMRLAEYTKELFRIAQEETCMAPTATHSLVPLLLGALPLLYHKLAQHCDLKALLCGLKTSLVSLAQSMNGAPPPVQCAEAESTFWHEIRLAGSSSPVGSCMAYEFGPAVSVALAIETLGDYHLMYWDPNKPGSLLGSSDVNEMRHVDRGQQRMTLETSRLVIAETQKVDNRRRRRTGSDRDAARPVSGVIRAFGTETSTRIGWFLDLIVSVYNLSAQIASSPPGRSQAQDPQPASGYGSDWVSSSALFQGGLADPAADDAHDDDDICLGLLEGTESGLQLWADLQKHNCGDGPLPGGIGTTTMLRAMLAALIRLTRPHPVAACVQNLAPVHAAVESHREALCAKLGSTEADNDDLVIGTFVKRCRFVVTRVREMGLGVLYPRPTNFNRKRSTADLTREYQREHSNVSAASQSEKLVDENLMFAASELLRLGTSADLDLEELEASLQTQRRNTEHRAEGFRSCANLVREAASLPLERVSRGFVLLEVLRMAVACVAACGSHPLSGCQGSGPGPSGAVHDAFFDLLRAALEAMQVVDPKQREQLQVLQLALLNFDWNAKDILALKDVGALAELRSSCLLPSDDSASSVMAPPMHLSPELWRGSLIVGRGLLSLKLSADALGAALYSPPGAEPSSSVWTYDHHEGSAVAAHAAETEVLHTVQPWVLDPPNPKAPRNSTAGCEYFEVRLTSVQNTQASLQGLEPQHPKKTFAIGVARAPPDGVGAPKHFVWWRWGGSFACQLGNDAPNIPGRASGGNLASSPRSGLPPIAYDVGTTIGCGILRGTNEVYFTRNGHLVGFHAALPAGEWYPCVWLGSKACLQCRFAPPFKFAPKHPFVKPLTERKVLLRRVRASAWKAMTSVALKAAKFGITDQTIIGPITDLISSGIDTFLDTSGKSVSWSRARAALSVLVRVAAGQGLLKPLVPDNTTKALFRLAAMPDTPLLLRVQALGVLRPVVSQSSPHEWDEVVKGIVPEVRKAAVSDYQAWRGGLSRAFLHLGVREAPLVKPVPASAEIAGEGMIRLLETFIDQGLSTLSVASSCLLRSLLGSPLWQGPTSTYMAHRLKTFAGAIKSHNNSVSYIMDSAVGLGFLAVMRVMGALPSVTECGMRVLVHSPGTSSTMGTVTEWHSNLQNARVLSEGVSREVSVSRLEPSDGPCARATMLPAPDTAAGTELLEATFAVTQAAFELRERHDVDAEEVKKSAEKPLPHLQWLMETACEEMSDANDSTSYLGLLSSLPNVTERAGVANLKGAAKVIPAAMSNWLLISCLRLLEAYADQYPNAARDGLTQRRPLLRSIAELCYSPKNGWSPDVAFAPSRAHLEAATKHQIARLKELGWGVPDQMQAPLKPHKPAATKTTLKIEPRIDYTSYADRTTHSCDGCGHHPLQVDSNEWFAGWYRCNECTDYDLCGRCFRRSVVHTEYIGHSFTDISQLVADQSFCQVCPTQSTSPSTVSDGPRPRPRDYLSLLLGSSEDPDKLQWLKCLGCDMASGGRDVAAMFPSREGVSREGVSIMADPISELRARMNSASVVLQQQQQQQQQQGPAAGSIFLGAPASQSAGAAVVGTGTGAAAPITASAEIRPNRAGVPAVKGLDGIYRCGAVVDGDAVCRCGYCQTFTTNRCGIGRGCNCPDCAALDRLTPDCVVDMQGIREQVETAAPIDLYMGLQNTSTALCVLSSRAIVSVLAHDGEEAEQTVMQMSDAVKPSSLARSLPELLNWKAKGWEMAGDFVTALLDQYAPVNKKHFAAPVNPAGLAIIDVVIEDGGITALHNIMGRLLWYSCAGKQNAPVPHRHWRVNSNPNIQAPSRDLLRVTQAPTVLATSNLSLLPGQVVVEVERCGNWLKHQYGWSPVEWGGSTLMTPLQPTPVHPSLNSAWIFNSSFDASLSVLRAMLLGRHGVSARAGRWQLATLLPQDTAPTGVLILAALVAAAYQHTKTRRRDALALVADLVPVFLKAHEGAGPPPVVVEGVEALTPMLNHVLSTKSVPISTGAPVWHAALELLVRLRRGLATAGASDIIDVFVKKDHAKASSSKLASNNIFALVEAFEDVVERIVPAVPVPLPSVLTKTKPEFPKSLQDGGAGRHDVRRQGHTGHSSRSRREMPPAAMGSSAAFSYHPPPMPDLNKLLVEAYRWGRPTGVRAANHPVLTLSQWTAFAQLASSTYKPGQHGKQSAEAAYTALQHHVRPSEVQGNIQLSDVGGGICLPLPDLTRPEVDSSYTTLININTMILFPIVGYLDLSPHGIQHSVLSKNFMAIKGLLMTPFKAQMIQQALQQTEVDSAPKPVLSFNRFPGHHADLPHAPADAGAGKKDAPVPVGPTTNLLMQLHSHLCDGTIQLAHSKPAFAVKFTGEEGIDIGGLYKDLLSAISQELMSPYSSLLIPVEDRFYLNPNCTNPEELALLGSVGRLMGSCLRTGDILGLDLHPLFWKKLAWEPCTADDHYDRDFFRNLRITKQGACGGKAMTEEEFADLCLAFSVTGESDQLGRGMVHDLVPNGRNVPVTLANRADYCRLAEEAKLKEGDLQINAVREGILEVCPNIVLALSSAQELETRISGRAEINIDELRKNAKYGTLQESEAADLWEALKAFSRLDRQRFLRFITGRPRMPLHERLSIRLERTTARHRVNALPTAHTCFNQLDLPHYSSPRIMVEQLLTAIRHCDTTDVH